ncbi:Protein ATP12 [Fusarium oxysporum f. sp. albedinis]|nr:Protein ATP12 [Fusarium oxysporum f. sp. albedinis]
MSISFPSHAYTRRRTDEIDVPMLRRTLEGEGLRASGNKLRPIDGALDTARSPFGTSTVLFPRVRLVGPSK